jgi:tetratricopeptide (TPR) repeat protein
MEADERKSAELNERAQALRVRGREHEARCEYEASARAFAELVDVQKSLGDESGVAEARFWEGTAWHMRGRVTEALCVFARSLDETALDIADPWLYMTITRLLRALVERPFPLAETQAALRDVEAQLREARVSERRSRLLLARARLALSRGRLREALALGEESLACRRHESHAFTWSSHYRVVLSACLWQGDLPRVRRQLASWAALGESTHLSRVSLTCRRAELARREGQLESALTLARGAWREAAPTEDAQLRVVASHAYVRALLLAGRLAPAREVLRRVFARLHRVECGEHVFALRALHADWHLARARLAAGLPMLDPECGSERRVRRPLEPAAAEPALARARRLYARAAACGHELDRLLGTRLRTWELEARLALCDRTEAELAKR